MYFWFWCSHLSLCGIWRRLRVCLGFEAKNQIASWPTSVTLLDHHCQGSVKWFVNWLSCQYHIFSVICHTILFYFIIVVFCRLQLCVTAVECDHRSFVLLQKRSRTLVWLGIKCKPMSRYNKLQNLYTKEIFQKVPETSTRSRHRLDFPTCTCTECHLCFIIKPENQTLQGNLVSATTWTNHLRQDQLAITLATNEVLYLSSTSLLIIY